MKAFLKRHAMKIAIVLFAGILLSLWGGFSLYQRSSLQIQELEKENKILKERVISNETNGLLQDFRFTSCEWDAKHQTASFEIMIAPKEISPTMTASIVWDGTERPLLRNKDLKNTFVTKLDASVTESHTISALTLKDGQRMESVEINRKLYPCDMVKTRCDARVTASHTFRPLSEKNTYSGDIKCYISDYLGESTATLLKIVNGEQVEEKQLRLKWEGLTAVARSSYKVEVAEDVKTEYVIRVRTEDGWELRHTALEIDGASMEHFAFNTKTEIYDPESGEFLFAVT